MKNDIRDITTATDPLEKLRLYLLGQGHSTEAVARMVEKASALIPAVP